MKKMSKQFLSLYITTTFLAIGVANADNFSLFNYDRANLVVPNCQLRAEYNYFMNQWTTNDVCSPKVYDVPKQGYNATAASQNAAATGNIYLGNIPNPTPSYYSYFPSWSGFTNTVNNWNGYGNNVNYLLGSFGGGYFGDTGGSLTSSNYYYGNYSYPNTVSYYTPTIYDSGEYRTGRTVYNTPGLAESYGYSSGDGGGDGGGYSGDGGGN